MRRPTRAAWRTELEAIEKAVPVLDAMSRRRRIAERRELVGRIDRLSSQILAASLIDTVEDAEIVGESDGADEGGTETEGPRTGSAAATAKAGHRPSPGPNREAEPELRKGPNGERRRAKDCRRACDSGLMRSQTRGPIMLLRRHSPKRASPSADGSRPASPTTGTPPTGMP